MPRGFLATILFIICCNCTIAQYDKVGAERLLKSALSSWQNGDTAITMRHLHDFYTRYPDNAVSANVCLRLGNLYVSMNKIDSAVLVLHEGLRTEAKWAIGYQDSAGLLYSFATYPLWKINTCLLLSSLAEQAGDYKLSLHYLILADTKYHSYWHCGTGYEDFRADLSPGIANTYLKLKDTAAAIDRLVKYFLYNHAVVQKLKPLLLTKFSQQEITRELNRSIASFKYDTYTDGDRSERLIIYSAFGIDIRREIYNKRNKKWLRKYLKTNQRMNFLRGYSKATPTSH